jgi:hypothetical protein
LPKTADEVTESLRAWVEGVLAGYAVKVVGTREQPVNGSGVILRLLNAMPIGAPRIDQSPYVLRLDYLVSVASDDPLVEHRLLGELLFAAMAGADFEPRSMTEAAEAVRAAGSPVMAGIVLSARLRREPDARKAPLVREPLVVDAQMTAALVGTVLGPGDRPVMDAVVEIPAFNLSALTDQDGRFRFAAAPSGTRPIRVVARKHRQRVQIDAVPGRELTIHIPLEG